MLEFFPGDLAMFSSQYKETFLAFKNVGLMIVVENDARDNIVLLLMQNGKFIHCAARQLELVQHA